MVKHLPNDHGNLCSNSRIHLKPDLISQAFCPNVTTSRGEAEAGDLVGACGPACLRNTSTNNKEILSKKEDYADLYLRLF